MRPATSSRTPSTEAQRIRAQQRATNQPIRYKLPSNLSADHQDRPSATSPSAGPGVPATDVDFAPLVRGALRAATLMVLAQVGTSILVANLEGALVRVAFWQDFLPYLQILTTPASYSRIWTWSVVAGVTAGCGGSLYSLWRHRLERTLLDGWATGILMAGGLLSIQTVQHVFFTPLLNSWVLAQAGAGVLATGMVFLGLRPGAEPPVGAGQFDGPTGPRRRGTRTQPPTGSHEHLQ